MRLLITGDTHGDQISLTYMLKKLRRGDVLFVAGDFGYYFQLNRSEEAFLNDLHFFLKRNDMYLVYVDGNHENHMALNDLPVTEWCGARVHEVRPNIIHVLRGEVLKIKGKKIFCFGGAFSIDRALRVLNETYWEEELPTDKDYINANKNLQANRDEVDYIITHTCPQKVVASLNGRHSAREEIPLQNYLQYVSEHARYDKWFFGHWHMDITVGKISGIYLDILDMETGERIL